MFVLPVLNKSDDFIAINQTPSCSIPRQQPGVLEFVAVHGVVYHRALGGFSGQR